MELGWVGLEPTTNALKGRCSTIELPTRAGRINVLIQFQRCRKILQGREQIPQGIPRPVQAEDR